MATFKDLNTAYSDGPDKLKNNYACYLHHNTNHGVGLRSFEAFKNREDRFMVTDFDCCCDPCNHSKSDIEVIIDHGNYPGSYCCSCTPNVITAQWVGNGNSCDSKSVFQAMWVSMNVPDETNLPGRDTSNTAHYSTRIVGRNLDAYLGPYEVSEAGSGLGDDGSGCRWTIWLGEPSPESGALPPGPGTKAVSYIDHVEKTCLKVPPVQFHNISGHGGLGTISFNDYYSAKVPFVRRDDEVAFPTGVNPKTGLWYNDFHIGRPIHEIGNTGGTEHPGGAINQESEFFPRHYAHIPATQTFIPPQTGVSVLLPSGRIGPPFAVGKFNGGSGFYATSGGPEINSSGFPPIINPTGAEWQEGVRPIGVYYPTIRTSGISGIYDGNPHSGIVGYCWPPENGFYATGRKFELCNEVPRFLCVDNARDSNGPAGNREFVFDTGYYPRFRWEYHPAYSGVEKFTIGTVLCRWKYSPLAFERTKTVLPNGGFNVWHNIERDKHRKYLYLYETFVDNIAEFSGDMMAVYQSGVPKRLLLPAFDLDPLEDDDQSSQSGGGAAGEFVSPDLAMSAKAFNSGGLDSWGLTDHFQNGIGPAYYGHSGIDGHHIKFKSQNEVFHWNSGTDFNSIRQIPWLGGIQHGLDRKYGDGSGECDCDMSVLSSRYIRDEGRVTSSEVDRMNIYSGRCGCWSYYCSDQCRCVPEKLCYLTFQFDQEGNTELKQGTLTWNYERIGWEGESGIDLLLRRSNNGFATGKEGKESYTPACVVPSFASESGSYFDKGFVMNDYERVADCRNDYMSFEFSDNLFDSNGVAQTGIVAAVYPSYADCDLRVNGCHASPCETGCSSHPVAININLYGYSTDEDEVCEEVEEEEEEEEDPCEGEEEGTCEEEEEEEEVFDSSCGYTVGPIDIQLTFMQHYEYVAGNPPELEPSCWYEGTYACESGVYKVTWEGPGSEACGLSHQFLSSGTNTEDFSFGPVGTSADEGSSTACGAGDFESLVHQTCEPYYASGTFRDGGTPFIPWFDCNPDSSGVARVDIVLTEI